MSGSSARLLAALVGYRAPVRGRFCGNFLAQAGECQAPAGPPGTRATRLTAPEPESRA